MFLLVIMIAGCAGSQLSARDLAAAEYRLPRDVMWTEILQALRGSYRSVTLSEFTANRVVTGWLESHRRWYFTGPKGNQAPVVTKVTITLIGVNPYRVSTDLEVGVWWSGPKPWPLPAGADTASVVPSLRGQLMQRIHERLKAREGGR